MLLLLLLLLLLFTHLQVVNADDVSAAAANHPPFPASAAAVADDLADTAAAARVEQPLDSIDPNDRTFVLGSRPGLFRAIVLPPHWQTRLDHNAIKKKSTVV